MRSRIAAVALAFVAAVSLAFAAEPAKPPQAPSRR